MINDILVTGTEQLACTFRLPIVKIGIVISKNVVNQLQRTRVLLSIILREMSALLGVEAICPYRVGKTLGKPAIEFAGYLSHFGGPRGILLDVISEPDYRPPELQKNCADAMGLPISFINPSTMFDAMEYQLALRDWGFFGKTPPSWW